METVLQDVGREPGLLPLMEDALFELWKRRNDQNVMTLSAYRASGGVQGALAQRADALFAERISLSSSRSPSRYIRITSHRIAPM